MNGSTIIDTGSELLFDCSRIGSPQLRMLIAAIGKPLVRGSAWVCVNKQIAAVYSLHQLNVNKAPRFAA